jgi:dTDP-4-dehydrorhamnose reductase
MKVLVIGKDGQLGSELVRVIEGSRGTSRQSGSGIFLDLTNLNSIEDIIRKEKPEVVINAAAYTNVDGCEENKREAFLINGKAVGNMARVCSATRSYFIHISTDYVFDGERGNYTEDDIPNPVNYYGVSKLMGEAYALSYDDSLVIRTSGVYGIKMNFPLYVVKTLKEGGTVNCIDSYYSPIHATLLAEAIKELIEKRAYGILNVSGERLSRYEFALKIKKTLDIKSGNVSLVYSSQNLKARRPYDSSLLNEKAKKMLSTKFYNTDKALEYMAKYGVVR